MRRKLLLGGSLIVFGLMIAAAPASAEITGNCTAQVSSSDAKQRPVNVASHNSNVKAQALKVPWDGSVTAGATSPGPAGGYKVELEYWGFKWKVGEGTTGNNSWSTTKSVKPFAIYGTGYYKVLGVTQGSPCTGAVLIELVGKKALETLAGKVALGLSVVGAFGTMVTSIACGFGKGMGIPKSQWVPAEISQGWQTTNTPGKFVHWCGNAAQHSRPPEIRRICGTQAFMNHAVEVCKG